MAKSKLWFKAKQYGWGWYPVTWEGWLTLFVYFGVNVSLFRIIDLNSHSGSDTLIAFFVPVVLMTFILILVCYLKGEKPEWRGGSKNTK